MADEEAKRLETPNGKAKQINILWTNIIGGAETKANWVSKSRTSQPAIQSVSHCGSPQGIGQTQFGS